MCVRKRRNTGSTARISALDAPMALNWLAAAQVALLLILTDNSAALCSYSATICLASWAALGQAGQLAMRRFGPSGAGVLSQGTVPSEGLLRQIDRGARSITAPSCSNQIGFWGLGVGTMCIHSVNKLSAPARTRAARRGRPSGRPPARRASDGSRGGKRRLSSWARRARSRHRRGSAASSGR